METALVIAIRDLLFTGAVAHGNSKYSSKSVGRRAKGRSTSSASSMTPQSRADLQIRPPTTNIPARVPRQVSNHDVWDIVKIPFQLSTVANNFVETNFSFSLNNHPQSAVWTQLFDQWCISQVSMAFESLTPAGSTVILPKLYTALDFDNTTAVGSVANLCDFATCEVSALFPQKQFVRSIKPCIKITNATGAATLGRAWQDSAFPATLWFGFRTILDNTNTPTVYPAVQGTATVWYAF